MTRPTSAETISASKSLRRCLITSLISLELIANSVPLFSSLQARLRPCQALPQLLEPGCHTGIDDPVSDPHHKTPDDGRVHRGVQPDLMAKFLGKFCLQLIGVGAAERDSGDRGGPDPADV